MTLFVIQFRADKKEVHDALNYARVNTPIWKKLIVISVIAIFFLSFIDFSEILTIKKVDGIGQLYFCLCSIFLIFESEHKNYIHSIRSFKNGLKLPGRNATLTPWQDVQRIYLHDQKVDVLLQNDLKTMLIDKRDMDEISEIIATWNEKRHG